MFTVNKYFLSVLSLGRGRDTVQWDLHGAQRINRYPEQVTEMCPEGMVAWRCTWGRREKRS